MTPGTRFGPYLIDVPLGAGGMGEVYRARDTRLDRDVAIKVLTDSFANDPDRRARFEREAKAVAALSHPNILAIHDTGIHDGRMFVVTELLEGKTLRDLLQAGRVPLRKATDMAVQMARGLAAAHDKGIVHRDLKPENVFLLEDGQVKILDFGLAHHVPSPSSTNETVAALTDPGLVMGTVGYMAPEQVRGQATDARTDLFALGAVLYEMLSGRRAFAADTAADTMFAIVKDDPPDLSSTRPDIPPALDRIVRHSLEKSPPERFQAARDVAFALEALSGSASQPVRPLVKPPARRWLMWAGALTGVVALASAGYVTGRRAASSASAGPVRFEARTFDPQAIYNARFAPDGRTIVFSSAVEGNTPDLYVLRPDAVLPQKVRPRTHLLAVSSRGELAVLTDPQYLGQRLFKGTLARMTIDGEPRPMMSEIREADWSPDGTSLAVLRHTGNTDRIEYPIGTSLYETPGYSSDLRVSPDGARVAFMDHPVLPDDRGWIKVVDRNRQVTVLTGEFWGEEGLAWSTDGRSVVFSAAEESPDLQVRAVPLAGPAAVRRPLPTPGSLVLMDISREGRWLAFRQEFQYGIRALVPGASAEREFPWLGAAIGGALSADGKHLLFTDQSASAGITYSVAMRRTDGSPAVRLGKGQALSLSPDGRWALSVIWSPASLVALPTGTGDPVELNHGAIVRYNQILGASWFSDSQRVVVCGNEASKPVRCYVHHLNGSPPAPIGPEGAESVSLAPGDALMAVTADQSVRVGRIDGVGLKPIPGYPRDHDVVAWSGDGRSLFIRSHDLPPRLERIEIASGKRTFIRELSPPERSGFENVMYVSVADDGRYYAYNYGRRLTTLFTVTGVQ